jgi:hypothetical protein
LGFCRQIRQPGWRGPSLQDLPLSEVGDLRSEEGRDNGGICIKQTKLEECPASPSLPFCPGGFLDGSCGNFFSPNLVAVGGSVSQVQAGLLCTVTQKPGAWPGPFMGSVMFSQRAGRNFWNFIFSPSVQLDHSGDRGCVLLLL